MKNKAQETIEALFEFYGEIPPPLNYSSVWQLTVAVVLSAQTTDRQVNAVTPELFRRYAAPEALAGAAIGDVEKIIHSVGFYRTKARNIIRLAAAVADSGIPSTIEELIKLPGVGRKSANVIVAQGFGKSGFAVDTHVLRLSHRLGIASGKTPDAVERELKACVKEEWWARGHLLLIHHGRTVCTARSPKCAQCPVISLCSFPGKIL